VRHYIKDLDQFSPICVSFRGTSTFVMLSGCCIAGTIFFASRFNANDSCMHLINQKHEGHCFAAADGQS
jgi:hypothetical protein